MESRRDRGLFRIRLFEWAFEMHSFIIGLGVVVVLFLIESFVVRSKQRSKDDKIISSVVVVKQRTLVWYNLRLSCHLSHTSQSVICCRCLSSVLPPDFVVRRRT